MKTVSKPNLRSQFAIQADPYQRDESSDEKITALSEMICRAGEEPSAALLVLMATFENVDQTWLCRDRM